MAETRQAVSMEFAVRPVQSESIDGQGRMVTTTSFEVHLLQVRPQASSSADQVIPMTDLGAGSFLVLARSDAAFGHLQQGVGFRCVAGSDFETGNVGAKR